MATRSQPAQRATTPEPDRVLTRAVIRVADALDLSQQDTARIVGVSAATFSRMAAGAAFLQPDTKPGELGLLLVRSFRALDALLGGCETDVRAWFHAPNTHLGGVPAERVRTVEGLVHVAEYLDAVRGKL